MIRLLTPMSLRTKLVLASVVVEVCMLTLLVGNSLRLMQDRLLDQARVRTTELNVLLNAAVAAPLAQRDYATLADLLEQSRRDRGIEYLALQERAGGPVVVAAGWERGRPLPAGKAEISADDIVPGSRLELYVPIELAGQTLGRLYYGISTEFLASARSHLLRQSLLIAGAEVVLSIVLLALVGLWLTRSLGELSRAAHVVADGNFDLHLVPRSRDEVGTLVRAFNAMAERIRADRQNLQSANADLSEKNRRLSAEATQRHEAERRLVARDALLRRLSERVPGAIYQYRMYADGRSCFPYASDGIRDIYEVTPGQVQDDATPVFGRLHPDDFDVVAQSIQQSFTALTPWRHEYRVILPQRGVRWLRGESVPERLDDGSVLWHGYIADVTEFKHAQEELQRAYGENRAVTEAVRDNLFMLNPAGELVWWNRRVEETTGLAAVQLRGAPGVSFFQEDDRPAVVQALAQVVVTGYAEIEARLLTIDGPRDYQYIGVRVLDEAGRVLGIAGSGRDISERKRTEQALRIKDDAIAASINGIAFADLAGTLTYVNRALLRMWGYDREQEVIGRSALEFWQHPDEAAQVLAALATQDGWSGELTARRQDGSLFVVLFSAAVIRDTADRPFQLMGSFVDITERRRAEEEARIFQNLINVAGQGIGMARMDSGVSYLNDALRRMLGVAADEDLAKFSFYDFYADEDRAFLETRVLPAVLEHGSWTGELSVRAAGGVSVPTIHNVFLLRDATGAPVALANVLTDITERRRAEEVLHSTTERFRHALRAARAGAWEWNIVTNQAAWSEENFTVLGLDPHTHQASFENWLACVHPDDRERCTREIKEALDAGIDLNVEFRVVWPNGEIRWINDVGRLTYDETGRPASMYGIQIDITDRKQAEELREASAMQLHAIVTASPVPQALNDEHQTITFLNPAFTRTFGYTREDIPTLADWWPKAYPDPEYRRWVAETWQDTLDKAQREGTAFPPLDLNVRCKNGTVKSVLASAAPIGNSFEGTHLVVLYDITDRRQAEQALRASEGRLRTILDAEPECVKILAADGTLLEMNPAGLAMLEADSVAQLQGRTVATFVTGEQRAAFVELGRRVIENGESGRLEFEIVGLKGTRRWLETNAVPLRDEVTGETRLLGVTRDITERRRAEEGIRTLNAELEQRVKDRTAELEAANRELEAFSYSVSHDLRAPLRAIDGFSRVLVEDHASHLDAEAQDYLNRVRNAVQRMGVLIDDLLDLSRVGRAAMHVTAVDLSGLAAEVVAQLRHGDPARTVEVDIAPGITAQGDPRLLRVVLENLLGNAWKYTGRTAAAHIAFAAGTSNGQRVYRIADNGAGFDMQYADKLFRPFQRLHTLQEFPGSGVGLATVARIVHRHGGRVWAEGEVGKGAAFFFTLAEAGARD